MTSIAASVAVVVSPLLAEYLVVLAIARGLREDQDYEMEVKLFFPLRVSAARSKPSDHALDGGCRFLERRLSVWAPGEN
jgi:hypothetical protein